MSNVWENNILLIKADRLVHLVYRLTRQFPQDEKYGLVSQLRRAALSIVLNIIEGYSRFKSKPHINFLEIAFGSAKETQYIIEFAHKEGFINQDNFNESSKLCEEVIKMLYAKLDTLKKEQL